MLNIAVAHFKRFPVTIPSFDVDRPIGTWMINKLLFPDAVIHTLALSVHVTMTMTIMMKLTIIH